MHPSDEIVKKYHALLKERDDCDRKIAQSASFVKRKEEIEKEIEELRPKMIEAASK